MTIPHCLTKTNSSLPFRQYCSAICVCNNWQYSDLLIILSRIVLPGLGSVVMYWGRLITSQCTDGCMLSHFSSGFGSDSVNITTLVVILAKVCRLNLSCDTSPGLHTKQSISALVVLMICCNSSIVRGVETISQFCGMCRVWGCWGAVTMRNCERTESCRVAR